MAKVNFKRIEDSSTIDNVDIEDGAFIVTGDGKTYVDFGNDRIPTSGTPDSQMSDVSRNTVENKVIKEYVDALDDRLSTFEYNLVTNGEAVKTGRKIDNKYEYVKRISTSIGTGTSKSVSTGLTSGVHEITDYKGYITNNRGTGIKVRDGFTQNTLDNSFMMHVVDGVNIQVLTGSNTGWITNDDICIIDVYYITL